MADGQYTLESPPAAGTKDERADVERVVRDFEDAKRHHDTFVTFVERMYRAYRGVLEKKSEAAQWTSKQHPAYGLQLVESVVSNMIDDRTTFMIKPRPVIDDAQRLEEYIQGARALENLIRYEMEQARFSQQQRPFALQNSIAGLTVAKIGWDYDEAVGTTYVPGEKEIYGENEQLLGTVPCLVEQEHTRIVRDGPSFDVVDCRDFFWPENAQDVQGAKYLIHRVWMSMSQLRKLEAEGHFKNVDKISATRDIQSWEGTVWRADELFLTNRKRNMVEVLEWWGDDGRVITIANRRVLLRSDKRPYNHRKRPFITASSMPQPFQFVGVSDMEIIEPLQRLLWTSINQTIDNVSLLNNAIVLLRDTADDQDYEFAPGEFWMVEDPQEVQLWQPNALPSEVAVGLQQRIMSDMNNITGGMGLISGDNSVDSETATGVSTLASIAQKRLMARRQQFAYAYEDAGYQIISLLQQFTKADRLVPVIGLGGAQSFERISAAQMQGNYAASVVSIAESLMRQEKRSEAQLLFTLLLQAAPVMAAVNKPLDMSQAVRDLLEAFDKEDSDRYFAAQPQPALAAGPDGPGGPAPASGPGPSPFGVTAPQSVDTRSPSNAMSLSPALMMQRALAAKGGGRSA